ncbi:flagellar protein FlhE [Cupriavidus basilensis]
MSPPILPTGYLPQAEGAITTVRWRYSFASTPPNEAAGLFVQCAALCAAAGGGGAYRGV